jgi:hypothetical protein
MSFIHCKGFCYDLLQKQLYLNSLNLQNILRIYSAELSNLPNLQKEFD